MYEVLAYRKRFLISGTGIPMLPPNASDKGVCPSLLERFILATPAIPPRNGELFFKYDWAFIVMAINKINIGRSNILFIMYLCFEQT